MSEQNEQMISRGREIYMTASEQAAMRHALVAYSLSHRPHILGVGAGWSWIRRHVIASSVLGGLLVLGASGVSAHMANPGKPLFSFLNLKLFIHDRIVSVFAINDDAQLDVEMRQIERQLDSEADVVDDEIALDTREEASGVREEKKRSDETAQIVTRQHQEEEKQEKKEPKDEPTPRPTPRPSTQVVPPSGDELVEELRQLEKELEQEESATIELED